MKALLYRNIVILVYVLLLPLVGLAQRAGDLDRSFNYGRGENYGFNEGYGANNIVKCSVVQPDGKIVIGGDFTAYNEIKRNRIARLNSDGSLDTTFGIGIGANGNILAIALQPDGKIIVGGAFTAFNGTARNRIARINTNGSLDTTFNPGTGVSSSYETLVYSISLQPDGKILIGGNFTSFNGTNRKNIARLNVDGSLDAAFNPGTGADNNVLTIALQSDGKVIIGGEFRVYNGTRRNQIARLNSNGSLDSAFHFRRWGGIEVHSIVIQNDNKIIFGGAFSSFNDTARNRIIRLNIDGSEDTSFIYSLENGRVQKIAMQADGKIIIAGGLFYFFNGAQRSWIARLNADGSFDATFNTQGSASTWVLNTVIQPDGKVIINGQFRSFNYKVKNYIARLNANGNLDETFNSGIGTNELIQTISVQDDGKIIIGGEFNYFNNTNRNQIARLNTNGSLDTTFIIGPGTNGLVRTTAIQNDGKIIIGGQFTRFYNTNRNYIARINTEGSSDATFNIGNGANYWVQTIAMQTDSKIIIGGDFTSFNGSSRNRIARLNTDGRLDATFNPGTGANDWVWTTAVQADGKIIIGGDFTSFNGAARNRIARLNANGSLDATFNPGTGANDWVWTTVVQADGKIIIGGDFTSFNGIARNRIARLNANGSLDTTFNPGAGANYEVRSILVQADGKAIIGGWFNSYNGTTRNRIARLNADGSLDATFNLGTGASLKVLTTTLQADGKIILGGNFKGYDNLSTPHIARIHGSCVSIPTTPTISGDTALCSGNTTRLTSSSPTGNLWSTGDTTQFINVAQAGSYSVRVINGGCTSAVSAPFRVVNAGPSPTVINFDTTSNRCLGARLQLTPAGTFNYYQWNTGERTRSIYTRTSGQYSVQVANSDSCFGLPSPPIFIAFDTNWCSVEIFRVGIDSITANVWADYYIWYLDGIELLSSNTLKTIPIQGDGVYTFRAVSGGRTSPLSNPIVITSTRKSLVTKFEVYPNPATNKVTVNTSRTGTLEILNTLGQVVITQPAAATNEFNLTHLAKGVYTVRFNGASKMLVVK